MNWTCPEVLEHALLRSAAWPIEILDAFAAPHLAAAAEAVLDAERRVRERRGATVAALYSAVPTISNPRVRAYFLTMKRRVYNGNEPLPPPSPEVQHRLAEYPEVGRLLVHEDACRRVLDESRSAFD